MQFSIAAVALLASAAMAHKQPEAAESTAYSTVQVTITSCGPTVTDCPAASTVTSASVVTSVPSYGNSSIPAVPTTAVPTVVETTPAPVVPTPEVCVPETVTSTVTVTAPTGGVETPVSPPVVVAPTGSVPGAAQPTASPPKNVTSPTFPPEIANGASGVQASMAFAAVAGVAAFLFA